MDVQSKVCLMNYKSPHITKIVSVAFLGEFNTFSVRFLGFGPIFGSFSLFFGPIFGNFY